jgi:hypothetical protein
MDCVENTKTAENWYYIIIRDPETTTEQFVGFSDDKTKEKFIPAFKNKEEAEACFALMPKDLFNGNYDAQAVLEEDLLNTAKKNDHRVYLLNESGTVLKHLN